MRREKDEISKEEYIEKYTSDPKNISRLIFLGMILREELNKNIKVIHPENKYINSIDLIEIYDLPTDSEANLKNCVIFGKGQVDRSPCGTGTSAKLAVLYSKVKLKLMKNLYMKVY